MSSSCDPAQCGTLPECAGCASNHSKQESAPKKERTPHDIKKVFAVVSGKGGVGKSSVTALLASAFRRHGYQVGVMDADITGPSMPRMFGVKDPVLGNGEQMLPQTTLTGIELMSINLLLENEDSPVIWRGPILGGVVQQFWDDVNWGHLDVMFLDMPPGTGDVPLTVFQSLPIDGIIVVTTPQDLVGMIVRKAVNMANMMNIPVLGLVENMSYAVCPDCGKKLYLFGESRLAQQAAEMNLPILATLPLNPATAALCDRGQIEMADVPEIEQAVTALESLLK